MPRGGKRAGAPVKHDLLFRNIDTDCLADSALNWHLNDGRHSRRRDPAFPKQLRVELGFRVKWRLMWLAGQAACGEQASNGSAKASSSEHCFSISVNAIDFALRYPYHRRSHSDSQSNVAKGKHTMTEYEYTSGEFEVHRLIFDDCHEGVSVGTMVVEESTDYRWMNLSIADSPLKRGAAINISMSDGIPVIKIYETILDDEDHVKKELNKREFRFVAGKLIESVVARNEP